jgi:hypothetical protein
MVEEVSTKQKIESKAMEEMCPKKIKIKTKKQSVELGNERSAQPDEFHFTHFTFRLKRNKGKTTYLPALGNLYAGKKCRKEKKVNGALHMQRISL